MINQKLVFNVHCYQPQSLNVLFLLTARCTIVQSAVLRSHVVRLSVRLETNCTDN